MTAIAARPGRLVKGEFSSADGLLSPSQSASEAVVIPKNEMEHRSSSDR
jgi:hypothetical protein